MRVGVDAHLLPPGQGYRAAGVAVYVEQLIRRLPRVAPGLEFLFFTPPGWEMAGAVPSRLPTSRPLTRIAWEQAAAPVLARRWKLDVTHGPVNVLPLLSTTRGVVTVHDLAFLKYPKAFRRSRGVYLKLVVGASVRKAAAVITPSRSTREDVIEHFGVDLEKVHVIPLGVDEHYQHSGPVDAPLDGPYVLYAGTLEPRKNVPLLLRAFAELRRLGYPHRLALVGGPGWKYRGVFELISRLGIEDAVVAPGFVEDLLPWYNRADLFIYPSVYEGFGLPPLEAMACGTPVITSSAGSLGEVVDDAALTFPPYDQEALLALIRSVLDNRETAERLRALGPQRAAQFPWDETARQTAAVYESLLT